MKEIGTTTRQDLINWTKKPNRLKRRFFWCFWMRWTLRLGQWLHPDDIIVIVKPAVCNCCGRRQEKL